MIKTILLTIAAIIAGLLSAFVLIFLVELFGEAVHPTPADSKGTMEEVCAHVASFPTWALAVVVGFWGATAFVSTWIAQIIGNRVSAGVIGLLLLAALVLNLSMLPYPIWFKVSTVVVISAAVVLGGRLIVPRKRIAEKPSVNVLGLDDAR
jgi:hypothetical protein